jgi:hypothetical protein
LFAANIWLLSNILMYGSLPEIFGGKAIESKLRPISAPGGQFQNSMWLLCLRSSQRLCVKGAVSLIVFPSVERALLLAVSGVVNAAWYRQ